LVSADLVVDTNSLDAETMAPDWQTLSGRRQVIVVGSQRLFREVLASFLSATGFVVVAEGTDVASVWKAIDPKARPEVLVYSLPRGPDDFEYDLAYAQQIRDRLPDIKIIALAEAIDPGIFLRTIPLEVDCILLSDASGELLLHAIELVLMGQQIFPSRLIQAAMLAGAPAIRRQEAPMALEYPLPQRVERRLGRAGALSERDRQIVRCLVQGLSNREVALRLNITEGTVKARVQGLLRKARVTNRTQAVMWALGYPSVR
jgi:two-component system, NarL family, nitrate/nitrite response regulator NarL